MNKKIVLWVSAALMGLLLTQCGKGGQNTAAVENAGVEELPEFDEKGNEHFLAFYVRFNRDSVFQRSRINFPLKVIPRYSYATDIPPTLWQPEQWVIQKELNTQDTTIRNQFDHLSDTWVSEHIYINRMFYMRRDFVRDTDKNQWRLDQYTEMQELARIIDPSRPSTITSPVTDTTPANEVGEEIILNVGDKNGK